MGHGGCGKTSLVSALLFDVGAVNRLGRVDDGTTVTDFDPDEIERKISLQAAPAFARVEARPRSTSSTPRATRTSCPRPAPPLRVADAALVVVDAVAGVEVQTEKVWGYAEEYGLARLIVVNRMDRENASFERTLENGPGALRARRGAGRRARGRGEGVRGARRPRDREGPGLRRRRERQVRSSWTSPPRGGKRRSPGARSSSRWSPRATRSSWRSSSRRARSRRSSSSGGLRRPSSAGRIFPVLPASSLQQRRRPRRPRRDRGPRALARRPRRGEGHRPRRRRRTIVAQARGRRARSPRSSSRRIVDPHAGRISPLPRLLGHAQVRLAPCTTRAATWPSAWARCCCSRARPRPRSPEIQAGDIGAVAKLKETQTGDTLADKAQPHRLPAGRRSRSRPPPSPSSPRRAATRTRSRARCSACWRRTRSCASRATRRPTRCCSRAWASCTSRWWSAACASATRSRSTSRSPRSPTGRRSRARPRRHGRHKKQTGGHGQFGDCRIRMKPLPRGADFKFVDDIFGGSIPKNFIPAVEKGIQDARLRGFLAGYPMVDFQVELYDGQYHDVDSSEMSFKIAGSLAFKDAVPKCRPTILEPIMKRRDRGARRVRGRGDGRPLEPPGPAPGHGAARARSRSSRPRSRCRRCSPTTPSSPR